MIKTIVFDLGGVLIDNPAPGMLSYYAKALGVSPYKLLDVFAPYVDSWSKGELTENDLWYEITNALGVPKPTSHSLWKDGFLSVYKQKSEVFALVKKLQQKGYVIALLSNTETPIMYFVKNQKWPEFSEYIYSCDVGMLKPDAEIYQYTLRKLDVKPDEMVFVDDKLENVEAATKLGIHGVLFISPQDLPMQLAAEGVTI